MAGHFFKKWSHRVVLGCQDLARFEGLRSWGPRFSVWEPFPGVRDLRSWDPGPGVLDFRSGDQDFRFWEAFLAGERFLAGDTDFGLGTLIFGLGTLIFGFRRVLAVFADSERFAEKRTILSLFFIENNFWNNISARDASPCFWCFVALI